MSQTPAPGSARFLIRLLWRAILTVPAAAQVPPGYYDSVRIPGARIHIDPHPDEGTVEAIKASGGEAVAYVGGNLGQANYFFASRCFKWSN